MKSTRRLESTFREALDRNWSSRSQLLHRAYGGYHERRIIFQWEFSIGRAFIRRLFTLTESAENSRGKCKICIVNRATLSLRISLVEIRSSINIGNLWWVDAIQWLYSGDCIQTFDAHMCSIDQENNGELAIESSDDAPDWVAVSWIVTFSKIVYELYRCLLCFQESWIKTQFFHWKSTDTTNAWILSDLWTHMPRVWVLDSMWALIGPLSWTFSNLQELCAYL